MLQVLLTHLRFSLDYFPREFYYDTRLRIVGEPNLLKQ